MNNLSSIFIAGVFLILSTCLMYVLRKKFESIAYYLFGVIIGILSILIVGIETLAYWMARFLDLFRGLGK